MKGVDVILFSLAAVLMEYQWPKGQIWRVATTAPITSMDAARMSLPLLLDQICRAVVVRVLGMDAAWKVAQLQVQTIWAA